jgi:hypothetical protein
VQTSSSAQAEDFASVLRGRRSIDLFVPDAVGLDKLMAAIELARWAPNHRLTEPWRFYAIGPTTMRADDPPWSSRRRRRAKRAHRARLEQFRDVRTDHLRSGDGSPSAKTISVLLCCAPNAIPGAKVWSQVTTGGMTRQQRFYDCGASCRRIGSGFFWYGYRIIPTQKRRPVAESDELPERG